MNFPKLRTLLLALLGLQGLLATWTWTQDRGPSFAAPEPLFPDFDAGAVTELRIEESKPEGEAETESHAVVLSRRDSGWVLTSHADYPAKTETVDQLLGALAGLRSSGPVVESAGRHGQLGVASDSFGRKVSISTGEKTSVVWLGDGGGVKRVNLRFDGEDAVHTVGGLSLFELAPEASSWIDTLYLELDSTRAIGLEITSPGSGTFAFNRDVTGWKLAAAAGGETGPVDPAKVGRIVDQITRLNLAEPVGTSIDPAYGLDPGLRVRVSLMAEGDTLPLEPGTAPTVAEVHEIGIGVAKDGKRYVKADSRDHVVLVSDWSLDQVVDFDLKKLAPDPAAPPTDPGLNEFGLGDPGGPPPPF